jgi:hypothetical protein
MEVAKTFVDENGDGYVKTDAARRPFIALLNGESLKDRHGNARRFATAGNALAAVRARRAAPDETIAALAQLVTYAESVAPTRNAYEIRIARAALAKVSA